MARRSQGRAEEQDHPSLVEARRQTLRPSRPENGFGLHIWSHMPDAHAVLIIDQAGWHTTKKLDLPSNVSIIALPARCPELNPVENIWQYMRDNWLSNLIFKSYDDIVSQCCAAWNKLVQQPSTITSIGMREWAHGF